MDAISRESIITAFPLCSVGADLLEIALILVLAAHLLLVNLAMAGPLGALVLEWLGSHNNNRTMAAIGRQLAWWSLISLVLAMLLGGALLVLESNQQGSRYWATLEAVKPSQLWFALAELGFYLAAMSGYLWLRGATKLSRITQRILAVFAATNLMYHFPPLFTVLSMISTRPELQGQMLDRPTLRGLMLEGEVLARVFHIWLASLAVVGLAMMVSAWRRQKLVTDDSGDRAAGVITWGARLALVATLLQLPVGLWVMGELPSYELLLGGDWFGTALFVISIAGVLRLMHLLASLALGDHEPRQIFESLAILTTVVTLMTGVLYRVEHRSDSTGLGFSHYSSASASVVCRVPILSTHSTGRPNYAARVD